MSEYIVEMKNITKKFPGIIANDDVTLQIKKGEIFALLGENGAGKSTIMSMLFGMYEPDEGEIFVRGNKVNITSPNEAAALNIGMVHQHFKLVSEYSITENIVLGIEPRKKIFGLFPYVDLKTAENKIKSLSKQFGLEVDPSMIIKDATVSIKQRVEILKMLYRDADILIFDEPTAVLTPQEIEFLLQIISNLRDEGKTIILITHKLEEIKKIADRCAVLCRGKLVGVRDVKDTTTKEMANLMVGREVSFELDKKEAEYGEEMLQVKDMTIKDKQGFPVVKNVNFSIHGGEIFAIAGVSGNGQVEIADAVAGLLPITSGSICLDGEEISQLSIRQRTQKGMGYIPEDRQEVGLVLDFSLGDNAVLKEYSNPDFCNKGFLNEDAFHKYGEDMVEKYDIRCGEGSHTKVRSMSGGNQQKIIIAREVERDAKLIIFVQPTRGLDIGAIENIHKQILAERDKGKAILLISLELDEVMNLADTIGVIYNGEISKIAKANTLTNKQVGEYMMGVRD